MPIRAIEKREQAKGLPGEGAASVQIVPDDEIPPQASAARHGPSCRRDTSELDEKQLVILNELPSPGRNAGVQRQTVEVRPVNRPIRGPFAAERFDRGPANDRSRLPRRCRAFRRRSLFTGLADIQTARH